MRYVTLLFAFASCAAVRPTTGIGSATPGTPSADAASAPAPIQALALNVAELRARAQAGDAEAAYLLALSLASGEGVARDRAEARTWATVAAEKGDPRAQNLLGLLHDPTWFGKRSEAAMAATWYLRAAEQGYSPATHNVQSLKDRKLVDVAIPDARPFARASLAATGGEGANSGPGVPARAAGAFGNEVDLSEGTKDARTIFAEAAPAVAEIVGDGNYGSGVAVGTLVGADGGYALTTSAGARVVPYAFFSRSRKEPVALRGRQLAVITNRHVLQGNNSVKVGLGTKDNGETQRSFPVTGVCLADGNAERDIALLFLSVEADASGFLPALAPVPLYEEPRPPAKGSVVFALGNPEKLPRTITQGLFNGERPEGLQFDAPISKGSSGGALLDGRGRLLGLIVGFASAEGSQNLNFAIPYGEIDRFLRGIGVTCYVP